MKKCIIGTQIYNGSSTTNPYISIPSGYEFAIVTMQDVGHHVENIFINNNILTLRLEESVTVCRINYLLFTI